MPAGGDAPGGVQQLQRVVLSFVPLRTGPGERSSWLDFAVLNSSGTIVQQTKYKPWGEVRSGSITLTDFGFTGQRTETSLGLSFYISRYYDSALGRFTQADSVITNPGVPLDFDRYAYTRNSPLMYRDPSGHEPSCDDIPYGPAREACIQSITLTEGSIEIKELFEQWRDTPGWWNEDEDFTLEDFLGLWILMETTTRAGYYYWIIHADITATAIAQNLFVGGWNVPVCYGVCTDNAVFNFINSWIDDLSSLLKGPSAIANKYWPQMNPLFGSSYAIRQLMSKWGSKALSRWSVIGDRDNGPSIWGNVAGAKDIDRIMKSNKTINGMAPKTVYYYFFDGTNIELFVSVKQWNNLKFKLKIDMTTQINTP